MVTLHAKVAIHSVNRAVTLHAKAAIHSVNRAVILHAKAAAIHSVSKAVIPQDRTIANKAAVIHNVNKAVIRQDRIIANKAATPHAKAVILHDMEEHQRNSRGIHQEARRIFADLDSFLLEERARVVPLIHRTESPMADLAPLQHQAKHPADTDLTHAGHFLRARCQGWMMGKERERKSREKHLLKSSASTNQLLRKKDQNNAHLT